MLVWCTTLVLLAHYSVFTEGSPKSYLVETVDKPTQQTNRRFSIEEEEHNRETGVDYEDSYRADQEEFTARKSVEDPVTNDDDSVTWADDSVTWADASVTWADASVTWADDSVTSANDYATTAKDSATSTQGSVTSSKYSVTSAEDSVTSSEDSMTSDKDSRTSAENFKLKPIEEDLSAVEEPKLSEGCQLSGQFCDECSETTQNRVIGGSKVKNRPWAALVINSAYFEALRKYDLCTGSLINRQFVLLAAHCGNLKEYLSVYLGFSTDDDISNKTKFMNEHEQYRHKVQKVIIHPGYRKLAHVVDIALLKLTEPVKFTEFIKPICLPLLANDMDLELQTSNNKMYVAGWGRSINYKCITDGKGPAKHIQCKSQCITDKPNPGADDPICTEFFDSKNETQEWDMFRVLEDKEDRVCIKTNKQYPWCNTYRRGTIQQKWGFCSKACGLKNENVAAPLKEVELSLINHYECLQMFKLINNSKEIWPDKDLILCAAAKNPHKQIQQFKKIGHGQFEHMFDIVDKSGINGTTVDNINYITGGRDSCNGDSGSALYTLINNVPTVIGTVMEGFSESGVNTTYVGNQPIFERGYGCAENLFPAKYQRVSRFLKWIHENTQEGHCNVINIDCPSKASSNEDKKGLDSSEDHPGKRKEGPEEVKPDNATEEKTTISPYGARQTFFQGSEEVKSVWKPLNKAGQSVAVL